VGEGPSQANSLGGVRPRSGCEGFARNLFEVTNNIFQ
jgi:hypothetical protein